MVSHAVEARTLVTNNRVESVLRCLEQCFFEFGCFAVGNLGHTFAFPNHSATKLFHVFGEDNLITGTIAEFNECVNKVGRFASFFVGCTHRAVDTAWEVNDFFVFGFYDFLLYRARIIGIGECRGPKGNSN